MHCVCCRVYLHMCLLLQCYECRRLFLTEHALMVFFLFFLFFCQAVKHSGRLIKSVPQAAAPIGSCNEKYT